MRLTIHQRGRWLGIAMAAVLLSIAAAIGGSLARADSSACGGTQCVVLVEVNGLTPEDVSPEKTPFLWALAHPDQPGDVPNAALAAIGGDEVQDRAGWIWQAARGVMTTASAPATASLLTGQTPQKSGVPADAFRDRDDGKWKSLAPGSEATGGFDDPSFVEWKGQSILTLVQEAASGAEGTGGTAAKAYLGDPSLFDLVTNGGCGTDGQGAEVAAWKPGLEPGQDCQNVTTGEANPSLCAPPPPALEPPSADDAPICAADDMQTLNAAATDVGAAGDRLRLVYIHLAELGIVKERGGDVEAALADLDAAMAQYVGQYAQRDPDKWNSTMLMVVGNHGMELTPQPLRVSRSGDSQPQSLPQFIRAIAQREGVEGGVQVVPNGTLLSVYFTGEQPARARVLKAIREEVLALNENEPLCAPQPDADVGPCIDEALYTSDPPDGDTANTVTEKHPTWRMGGLEDLVITTGRGWAAAPVVSADTSTLPPDTSGPGNPGTASSGGPRNRAVAALVHGPEAEVFQFPWDPVDDSGRDGRHPVTQQPADGDPRIQQPAYEHSPENPAVEQANAEPGDDAAAVGHEQQPLTIDFMPTIAAMLRITVPPEQPDGNIIQSPWRKALTPFVIEEDLGEPEPEPPPVIIEEPPVIIPPPPVKTYDFTGLIQKLKAQVGTIGRRTIDGKKQQVFVPAREAKKGALLNYLALKADFGKPLAQVTLTLYRRVKTKGKSGKKRTRLVTLARFSPFTVKRGPGVELRFAVPPKYKPTNIGVLVQEAEKVSKENRKEGEPDFQGVGPQDGGIVSIKDASRLHKRVGRKRR